MKIFRIFFLFTVIFLITPGMIEAQEFEWAVTCGSYMGKATATDVVGNIYVSGVFQGGPNTFGTKVIEGFGNFNVFIAKFDKAGNCLWVQKGDGTGGSNMVECNGISIDNNGSCYVSGYFNATLKFDTTVLSSYGESDIFTAKYDSAGSLLWVKQAGGTNRDEAFGISTDASGNCYITGLFGGTSTFDTTTIISPNATFDMFLAKYNAEGNLVWVTQAGGNSEDFGRAIATDASGNSYVTGQFVDVAYFDTTKLTYSGMTDIFIAKYDNTGKVLWAKQAGGSDYDMGLGVALDADGNCYITGDIYSNAIFDTTTLICLGRHDIFVAKYDKAGNCKWAKEAGGPQRSEGFGISASASGYVYVSGSFAGTISFGAPAFTSDGIWDIFVAKYDNKGNCLWAKKAGSSVTDWGYGVSTSADGSAYVTGGLTSAASFGNFNIGIGNSLTGFLAKISPDNYTDIKNKNDQLTKEYQLFDNFPNPFNPSTTIKYGIPRNSNVTLKVFNSLGQLVSTIVNEFQNTGYHSVLWNGSDFASGVYFYELNADGFRTAKKLLLMK